MCSGEYSQGCEAGISPLAKDIDWSLCDPQLKEEFNNLIMRAPLMTDKDKYGLSLKDWKNNEESSNFIYQELKEKDIC